MIIGNPSHFFFNIRKSPLSNGKNRKFQNNLRMEIHIFIMHETIVNAINKIKIINE